ncbi:transcriptional regulator [Sorangium cellulosum]|uniref:Transcriptional regulator n=1 Tax=Sorangium cellulosum TaxID=56 RepID=A0A2L0ESS8_SORCE|nr:FMN-binding negative transcriptional regulator [Sorangium cellulosum]AUX42312.1 transcriptional regulator [Sorangium cellulosum]
MYIPKSFHEQDESQLLALIGEYGFATLVTSENNVPFATHLPLLADRDAEGRLLLKGHVARANPQWRAFAQEGDVLAVFAGPHAYVSPSVYRQPGVPTWNYAVVHAYGRPSIVEEPAKVLSSLRQLASKYEAGRDRPWSPDDAEALVNQLLSGIVAFEITVTRLEGKFKLSQNRDAQDYDAVMRFVELSNPRGGEGLVEMMASRNPKG